MSSIGLHQDQRFRIYLECVHCGGQLGRTDKTYSLTEAREQLAKEKLPLLTKCHLCGTRFSRWLVEAAEEMRMVIRPSA